MTVSLQSIDRESWQRLALSFLDYNYRQLWDFGTACAKRLGAFSDHVAIYCGPELIGLADIRVKRIPIVNTGIAYINGGPLVRRTDVGEQNAERLRTVLAELIEVYAKQQKLVLRIQPPLGHGSWDNLLNKVFLDLGFVVSNKLRAYRTFVVDLASPLEDIRKQLNQKWRNCLNNAEKKELTVKSATD